MTPFLDETVQSGSLQRLVGALGSIAGSFGIGIGCAALALLGAHRLEKQPEHQHLLILGCIIFGVGTAIYLDSSVFLPMLIFGFLIRALDHQQKVVAIRIASDARVFLVITFVLAGAALDIAYLGDYWPEALLIVFCRFLAQWLPCAISSRRIGLTQREALFMSIGLQPMSSVALVLLANTQMLYAGLDPKLTGILLAAILLMQLFGPLTTQTAIKGFGEASRLLPLPTASATQGDTPS